MDLLMPLRIPQSYAVSYNKFYDVIPIYQKNDIFLENIWYFTEDIMQIYKMDLDQCGNWYIPEEPLIIDLGWYPDVKSNGSY